MLAKRCPVDGTSWRSMWPSLWRFFRQVVEVSGDCGRKKMSIAGTGEAEMWWLLGNSDYTGNQQPWRGSEALALRWKCLESRLKCRWKRARAERQTDRGEDVIGRRVKMVNKAGVMAQKAAGWQLPSSQGCWKTDGAMCVAVIHQYRLPGVSETSHSQRKLRHSNVEGLRAGVPWERIRITDREEEFLWTMYHASVSWLFPT